MNFAKWYKQSNTRTVLDKHSMSYNLSGNGPNVLCIHGFPSSSWDFAPLWHALSKQFTVIAPDLIGLGNSEKPSGLISIKLQADAIEDLMIQLDAHEVHILAHDLGDTIAQELLARQLDGLSKIRWTSCALMNGGLFPETHRALFIQKVLLSPLGSIVVHAMTKRVFKKNMYKIFSSANPPSDDFIENTWNITNSNNGRSMIPKLIQYINERKENRARWVDALSKASIPLRLILGEDDPISGRHLAIRYRELVPNADIDMIPCCGHYPHIEKPETVLRSFLDFHGIESI